MTMTPEDAERLLATSPDHRILKRVPDASQWALPAPSDADDLRRALFLDVESTGLDPERDEVIEIALLPFDYRRASGDIVRVRRVEAFNALRQPSFPIPPQSTAVHGLTDADVAGHVIADADIEHLLRDAHLVIAHNAGFDRPMVEKHWPFFADISWACSLSDIPWRAEGFAAGKLDYLLMRQGWFYEGHRALTDALAGVFLLTQHLPQSGVTAMQALLDGARRPLKAVRAESAPFEARAALKQRGYRWDPGDDARAKAWWILTDAPDDELSWLASEIYAGTPQARVVSMPATRRYSARLWM